MNFRNIVKTIVVLCTILTNHLYSQNFNEMYESKITNLDRVAALDVMQYYNKKERDLLVNAIDDTRLWLEPIIADKIGSVLRNDLLTDSQTESVTTKNNEYMALKKTLEEHISQKPAYVLGTGYTKSQWDNIHRAAKNLIKNEKEFNSYLNRLQGDLDRKAAEIVEAKRNKEKEEVEKNNSPKEDDVSMVKEERNIAKDRETEIYKYSTFGLLIVIGIWLFFRFKDSV